MGWLQEADLLGTLTSALFTANTLLLLVLAGAFFVAWRGQRSERAFLSWIASNLTLAAAFLLFVLVPADAPRAMVLPNVCLLLAIGLHWRAARRFNGRSTPVAGWAGAAIGIVPIYAARDLLPYSSLFMTTNGLALAGTVLTAWEFWRDRGDGLRSRYGLVFAYGVISITYLGRVLQGPLLDPGVSNLPQDGLLAVGLLLAVVNSSAAGAFALSLAYERSSRELRQAAMSDPLTGLFNRRAFEGRMAEVLSEVPRRPFALVLLDIDRFKAINDSYGHSAGDDALRTCAAVCARELRPGDFLARIGGEEFAALLLDVTAAEALSLVDGVRRAVEGCEVASGSQRFGLTLSAGIFHGRAGPADLDGVMRQADAQLYAAKDGGRNTVTSSAAA